MSEPKQDRNRAMVALRGEGLDNTEIGRQFGISRERVRQVLGKGSGDALVSSRTRAVHRALHEDRATSLGDVMNVANNSLRRRGARAMCWLNFRECLKATLAEEGMTIRQFQTILRERTFWNRVDRRGSDECWPWTAGTWPSGYGHLALRGLPSASHRAAWVLAHGKIPAGKWILHRCGNAICCNPEHLYAGTAKDNTDDRRRHGRWTRQLLSEEEVRLARSAWLSGKSAMSIWRELGKGSYNSTYKMIVGDTYRWVV